MATIASNVKAKAEVFVVVALGEERGDAPWNCSADDHDPPPPSQLTKANEQLNCCNRALAFPLIPSCRGRGVVHAWVGQNHLNCFIFKCFFLSVIAS